MRMSRLKQLRQVDAASQASSRETLTKFKFLTGTSLWFRTGVDARAQIGRPSGRRESSKPQKILRWMVRYFLGFSRTALMRSCMFSSN